MQIVQVTLGHLMEEAGREPEEGHLLALDEFADLGERRLFRWEDGEGSAIEHGAPDFESGGIEREGREPENDVRRVDRDVVRLLDEADDAAMRNADPLRRAGGA